jgi:hypothetical protein
MEVMLDLESNFLLSVNGESFYGLWVYVEVWVPMAWRGKMVNCL